MCYIIILQYTAPYGCNTTYEFTCRRDFHRRPVCIPGELTCDGSDNCGDRSDESASWAKCPQGKTNFWLQRELPCVSLVDNH